MTPQKSNLLSCGSNSKVYIKIVLIQLSVRTLSFWISKISKIWYTFFGNFDILSDLAYQLGCASMDCKSLFILTS